MPRRKAPIIADAILDQLLAGREAKDAFGRDGLLDALKKALAERALNAELEHHLAAGEPDDRAKFWLREMNELKTRGVEDILIAIVDGLKFEGLSRSDQRRVRANAR